MSRENVGKVMLTFSGIDGCGKSTQLNRLGELIESRGGQLIKLWSRGGYTSGMQAAKRFARRLGGKHLPSSGHSEQRTRALKNPLVTRVWLTAALLDLIRVYGVQLRWYRLTGRSVLCDRYLWDSLVDFKMAFPDVEVERSLLWRLLQAVAVQPEHAFFFALNPDVAEQRSIQKGDPWPEPLAHREQRLAFYEDLISAGRFVVVDATQTEEQIFSELASIIAPGGEAQ